ncbi:MAG: hypothetical protein ACRES7_04635 [Gammaproteobacteria bacterium]
MIERREGIVILRVKSIFPRLVPSLQYHRLPAFRHRWLRPFLPLLGYLRWLPVALPVALSLARRADAVLYTANNPLLMHLFGVCGRRRFKGWIAEFRDPMRGWEDRRYSLWNPLVSVFESLVMRQADRICLRKGLPVSPQELARRYPTQRNKIIALPDYGVDLAPYTRFPPPAAEGPPDGIRGVFAGNFYGNFNGATLAAAVAQVNGWGTRLAVEVFGADGRGIPDEPGVSCHEAIPYWDLIQEYRRTDFLIAYVWIGTNSDLRFRPSKLAELIAAQRPLLVILNRPAEVGKEVEAAGIGVSCGETANQIAAGLVKIVHMISARSFNLGYRERVWDAISNEAAERAFREMLMAVSSANGRSGGARRGKRAGESAAVSRRR